MNSKRTKNSKKKIPFLWKNLTYTKEDLFIFWKPITGAVAIYGLVYAFIVIGFNFLLPLLTRSTSTGVLASEQNEDALTKFFSNISSSVSFVSGNEASTAVQFVLAFLALVSVLRKTRKLGHAKISDAYYEGTGQFVAIIIIFMVFLLFLIPMSVGSTIMLAGISFASTVAESIGIWLVFLITAYITIWLCLKYWPALYIASLPAVRPIFALKQASKLTKGYKLNIFFQFLGFFILSSIVILAIFAPVGIFLPTVAPYWLFIIILSFFAITVTFSFTVYRSLVDD